jgi:hypothetical protein
MQAIILLATAAIAIPFVVAIVAPDNTVGAAVSSRFLERSLTPPGATIPPEPTEKPLPVTAASLHAWVTAKETAGYARAYAWRVMPLDLLYLAVLGGFLALGASTLASTISWPPALARLPVWTWLILPATYVLADIIEDCLIVLLMTLPASINNFTVWLLAALRNIKIGANAFAMVQIFALGLAGVIWK